MTPVHHQQIPFTCSGSPGSEAAFVQARLRLVVLDSLQFILNQSLQIKFTNVAGTAGSVANLVEPA